MTLTKISLLTAGGAGAIAAGYLAGSAYLIATSDGDADRADRGLQMAKDSFLPLVGTGYALLFAGGLRLFSR